MFLHSTTTLLIVVPLLSASECPEQNCTVVECDNGGTIKSVEHINGSICDCPFGFAGDRCQLHDCGHGTWDNSSQKCLCKAKWSGSICRVPACPKGAKLVMTGQEEGVCKCSEKREGAFCQYPRCANGHRPKSVLDKPFSFAGHRCTCPPGQQWTGPQCGLCLGIITRRGRAEFCCRRGRTGKYCHKKIPGKEYEVTTTDPSLDSSNSETKYSGRFSSTAAIFIGIVIAMIVVCAGICFCQRPHEEQLAYNLQSSRLNVLIASQPYPSSSVNGSQNRQRNPYPTDLRLEAGIPLDPSGRNANSGAISNPGSPSSPPPASLNDDIPPSYEDVQELPPPSYDEAMIIKP